MKILALVTDAFVGAGGIACYNRDLLMALAAEADVAEIRVLPRHGQSQRINEKLLQTKPHPNKLTYSWAACREARRFRPDRVFCGHLFMLPLAAWIGRWLKVPVWLQLHGIEAWQCPSPAVRRALSHVDFITCVSRYSRQRFLAWADLDPWRAHVLPNTLNPRFVPSGKDRHEVRRAFELDDGPLLLTVGRLAASERYKGHDRVLACLPEVRTKHPNLTYAIAGDGDDRARLEQLAERLDVAKAVRFLGEVDATNLPKLYETADLFVMPSTGEGFGIVYLEAMGCGTPALGFASDGSRDPLRDGDLGRVAESEALAEAILGVLAQSRPAQLSANVHALFGQVAFRGQVGALLNVMRHTGGATPCAA